jgi:pimeloyl-ACP methyl ester carboxylesterase
LPQHVLALAAKRPELFRRIVVMNAPLVASHAYPPQMATYTRPFGMGKGASFDAAGYLYNGNEFALPADVLGEYEKPYVGEEAEAARAAVEADVKKALSARGLPKIRVVWGTADRYLDDAPIYDWCADIRASFSSMRKVGHMPQEDFPTDAAVRCAEFFTADLRASAKAALKSVRVGKITTDDGTG